MSDELKDGLLVALAVFTLFAGIWIGKTPEPNPGKAWALYIEAVDNEQLRREENGGDHLPMAWRKIP